MGLKIDLDDILKDSSGITSVEVSEPAAKKQEVRAFMLSMRGRGIKISTFPNDDPTNLTEWKP